MLLKWNVELDSEQLYNDTSVSTGSCKFFFLFFLFMESCHWIPFYLLNSVLLAFFENPVQLNFRKRKQKK